MLKRKVFTALFLTVCSLPATTSTVLAQRKGGIRSVNFRNFAYHPVTQTNWGNDGREEKRARLVLRRGKDGQGSELKSVKYVDLDGDGKEEALVTISTTGGGSMEDLYLEDYFFFAYRNGRAVQLFTKSRFNPRGISVDGRDLIINAPYWGPDAPRCCPIADEVAVYQWSGQGFVEVSRDRRAIR